MELKSRVVRSGLIYIQSYHYTHLASIAIEGILTHLKDTRQV